MDEAREACSKKVPHEQTVLSGERDGVAENLWGTRHLERVCTGHNENNPGSSRHDFSLTLKVLQHLADPYTFSFLLSSQGTLSYFAYPPRNPDENNDFEDPVH